MSTPLEDLMGKSTSIGISVGIERGVVTLFVNAANGTSKANLPVDDARALAHMLTEAAHYIDGDDDEVEDGE